MTPWAAGPWRAIAGATKPRNTTAPPAHRTAPPMCAIRSASMTASIGPRLGSRPEPHDARPRGRLPAVRAGTHATTGPAAGTIRDAMTSPSTSFATPYRTHTAGELRAEHAGQRATLSGWVHRRREHGKLTFLDIRDRYGITQVVVDQADAPDAHRVANRIRSEFVVTVEGEVALRQPGTENAKLGTGAVELQARTVTILNESKTPPFYVNEPDAPVEEGTRL